jgi:hypothetical protein
MSVRTFLTTLDLSSLEALPRQDVVDIRDRNTVRRLTCSIFSLVLTESVPLMCFGKLLSPLRMGAYIVAWSCLLGVMYSQGTDRCSFILVNERPIAESNLRLASAAMLTESHAVTY